MTYPPFSVSMCVYGGDNPEFFDAAVESVVRQSVPPAEIVLTVDGPIPRTIQAVIDKYRSTLKEISFRVIYLERNMGHGQARRTSFDHCTHRLIALMDADDLSLPERFRKQLDCFAADPELDIVGGTIQEFVDVPEQVAGRRVVPLTDGEIKDYMKRRCPMNQMTVMFRKEAVAQAGGYLDWYCDEDYYLWIRMALAGKKFANLPDVLVHVRVGREMYSRRGGWKYFQSEAGLQRLMLQKGIIGPGRYGLNVAQRLALQVLMPNRLRSFLFRKLARE